MRAIPISSAQLWRDVASHWCPTSINTVCPHCSRIVVFALQEHNWDSPRQTVAATARCPGCNGRVSIWVVQPGPSDDKSRQGADFIMIHPGDDTTRKPIEGINHIPAPLRQAYLESVQVFNAGIWSATASSCRRTLEGVVKQLANGGDEANLARLLQELPQRVDLTAQLRKMADAIRLGGNIGAHFNEQQLPDRELAQTTLDLLEYLLEYFFTIPHLVDQSIAVLAKHRNQT